MGQRRGRIRRVSAAALAGLMALALAVPALAWRQSGPTALVFGGLVPRRYVALTFDDGPRRKTTQPLLDGLARRGVPATFFLIGLKIPGNEDLVVRMAQEGHQVGIHAQNHDTLTSLEAIGREVAPMEETLKGLLGQTSFMVRPPYGKTTAQVRQALGAPVILWSVDPEDWSDTDSDRQVAHIVSQVEDGSIVLLHDVYPSSVDTALRVVDALLEQGYCFVTVEQLFALRGMEAQPGQVYRKLSPQ